MLAIHEAGFNTASEPVYAIHQAAHDFGVPNSTLQGHYHGRKLKKEAHAHKHCLLEVEEEILVKWIVCLGHQGVPMTLSKLQQFASDFTGEEVGEKWLSHFVKVHPELKVL
ncbi:hypothetical protein BDN71DRAFT_1401802 [Pleurotus eryngii]|uniref:HTH CENPB-type domain-containing protein n=1 Tax=Pleurotus eryngii TaxID=5323 RepID=A0A9P6D368_PLEER|nr:hypothetical protein BDN71DRAFT_1401802 [Pleurotus eryngii]